MQVQNNKANLRAHKTTVQNTASQAQIIAQAKQGDVEAIQELMGGPLKRKSIWVRVKRKEDTLMVTMTGKSAPAQKSCLDYVQRGLTKLDIAGIKTAHVTGYQTGKFNPVWAEDIHLNPGKRNPGNTTTRAWAPGARIRSSHLKTQNIQTQNIQTQNTVAPSRSRRSSPEKKGGLSVWAMAAILLSLLAIGGITWAILNTPNTQRQTTPESVQ